MATMTWGVDACGVPLLVADCERDLSYLQGLHAASTRAVGLDAEHRRLRGEMAVINGRADAASDIYFRQLDLDGVARAAFYALDQQSAAWFAEYARGVNAGLWEGLSRESWLPYPRMPLRWQPHTPLAVMLSRNHFLSNFPATLARRAARDNPRVPTILFDQWPGTQGSNAWAHRHAAGGLPLLAADPHRLHEYPSCYYPVRLRCPEYTVAGLAFTGVPGTPHYGMNDHIAWVTASAMVPTSQIVVHDDGAPSVLSERIEVIGIKGEKPQQVRVATTAIGALITGVWSHPVSVRSSPRLVKDCGTQATRLVMASRTAHEAVGHMAGWVDPISRFIVADSSCVLEIVVGKAPRRSAEELTCAQSAGDDEARGVVSWPGVQDVDAFVVCANESDPRTAADTVENDAGIRAVRIRDELSRLQAPGTDDFARLQHDSSLNLGAVAWCREAQEHLDPSLWPFGTGDVCVFNECDPRSVAFGAVETALCELLTSQVGCFQGSPVGSVWGPWLTPGMWMAGALARHGVAAIMRKLDDSPGLDTRVKQMWQQAATRVADHERVTGEQSWPDRHRLRTWIPVARAEEGARDEIGPVMHRPVTGHAWCINSNAHVSGITDRVVRGPLARVVLRPGDFAGSGWSSAHNPEPAIATGPLVAAFDTGEVIAISQPVTHSKEVTRSPEISDRVRITTFQTGGQVCQLTRYCPEVDADFVVDMAREERAQFWGMTNKSEQEIRGIYDYLDSLATHTIVVAWFGESRAGILHLYAPESEAIGGAYPVRTGDLGLHVMMHRSVLPHGVRREFYAATAHSVITMRGVSRLIVEPDVRNQAAIALARAVGFSGDQEVELPDKKALLLFRERS